MANSNKLLIFVLIFFLIAIKVAPSDEVDLLEIQIRNQRLLDSLVKDGLITPDKAKSWIQTSASTPPIDYATETLLRNKELVDSLVNSGLITPDQATSFLQDSVSTSVRGAQPIDTGPRMAGELDRLIQPKVDRAAQLQQEIAESMARQKAAQQASYPAPRPTFGETLQDLSQDQSVGGTERTNYTKALRHLVNNPEEFEQWNMQFASLSDKAKKRALNRIAYHVPLRIAVGAAHLNIEGGFCALILFTIAITIIYLWTEQAKHQQTQTDSSKKLNYTQTTVR